MNKIEKLIVICSFISLISPQQVSPSDPSLLPTDSNNSGLVLDINTIKASSKVSLNVDVLSTLLVEETPVPCPAYINFGDRISEIDPITGVITDRLNTPNYADIALSPDNKLYGTRNDDSTLDLIDIEQGTITVIAPLQRRINGLAFATDNKLYGVSSTTRSIYEINLVSGVQTLLAQLPSNIDDFAFYPITNEFIVNNFVNNMIYAVALNGDVRQISLQSHSANGVAGAMFVGETLYFYTNTGEQWIIDPETGTATFDRTLSSSGSIGAASAPCFGSCHTGGLAGCPANQTCQTIRRLKKKK